MAFKRRLAVTLAALILLISVAESRWVYFQQVSVSELTNDESPATFIVIQEEPVEQPIPIVDALENVDNTLSSFWVSLLRPLRTQQDDSFLMSLLNPFAWTSRLEAVESSQRAALDDMFGGSSSNLARQAYEQQQQQQQAYDGVSVDQMLRQVGCSRFRPAMEDYQRLQGLSSAEIDAALDGDDASSFDPFSTADLSTGEEASRGDDDYYYAEQYDALPLKGRGAATAASDAATAADALATGEYDADFPGWTVVTSSAGEGQDEQRDANRHVDVGGSSGTSLLDSLLESLASLAEEAQSGSETGRMATQEEDVVEAGWGERKDGEGEVGEWGGEEARGGSDDTLGRTAADALEVEYLGAEDEATNTALLAHQAGGGQQTYSLSWSRDGGLVLEAEPEPLVGDDNNNNNLVQPREEQQEQQYTQQQQQQPFLVSEILKQDQQREEERQRWAEEVTTRVNSVAEQYTQQYTQEQQQQPLLVSEILQQDREREEQQQQATAAVAVAGAATGGDAGGNAALPKEEVAGSGALSFSGFSVTWSSDSGLVVETYGSEQQQPAVAPALSEAQDGAEDESWALYDDHIVNWNAFDARQGSGFDVDDLDWEWTDAQGNLNWGLVVLTLLTVASAAVAVAAVHSYLVLRGTVREVAAERAAVRKCCGGGGAPRRLKEPLLVEEEEVEGRDEEEGPALTVNYVAGAKVLQDVPSYSVEYAALYAEAQGHGRKE